MSKKDILELDQIAKSDNVVPLLSKRKLGLIGSEVVEGYEIDKRSCQEWMDTNEEALKLAKLIKENKDFPWPGCANIKMPIIAKAGIEYASRTMPEIIQNDRVVKGVVVGKDDDGEKQRRSDRVAAMMSYQLVLQSPDWEDSTDSLIQMLPILGTVFKKTWWDPIEKRVVSETCAPDKIIVNYGTQSLVTARRITHIMQMYRNGIIERQRLGIYDDSVDPDTLGETMDWNSMGDNDAPMDILEQHCFIDLDGDGYREPYVVTVHKDSMQVLRIVPRFAKINKNSNGEVINIKPTHFFTSFHFIKSPDGGFYSMGFGSLLLPMNTTINTLVNQLLDSGTISNTQGGIISGGLRLKNGEMKFKMGEWKIVPTVSGQSLAQSVFPLPVREPSQTLFSLLGLMLQEAKDLSSVSDVMLGKQPAQNVASSTINQLVEQGSKIFTAINKRVYRSLRDEYQKVYRLNHENLSNKEYRNVMDDETLEVKKDFDLESCDIYPIADPTLSSNQQKLMKAMAVQQLPTADKREADRLVLDCLQIDDAIKKRLLPDPDPNAPPPLEAQKVQAEIAKLQAEVSHLAQQAALATGELQIAQQKFAKDLEEADARINESIARVWKMQQDALNNARKMETVNKKVDTDVAVKQASVVTKVAKDQNDMEVKRSNADTAATKVAMDAALRTKELEINKDSKDSGGSKSEGKKYRDEDISYTARLKGLSVSSVKKLLGVE